MNHLIQLAGYAVAAGIDSIILLMSMIAEYLSNLGIVDKPLERRSGILPYLFSIQHSEYMPKLFLSAHKCCRLGFRIVGSAIECYQWRKIVGQTRAGLS